MVVLLQYFLYQRELLFYFIHASYSINIQIAFRTHNHVKYWIGASASESRVLGANDHFQYLSIIYMCMCVCVWVGVCVCVIVCVCVCMRLCACLRDVAFRPKHTNDFLNMT
jgi:hypothetical protein